MTASDFRGDTLSQAAGKIMRNRATHVAIGAWAAVNAAAYVLADGFLPFDTPSVQQLPFNFRMLIPTISLLEVFTLMAIAFWLTRKRAIPDIATRAPDRTLAGRETAMLLGYAALAQIGGWLLGPALGYRAFSFHIAGTLYGGSVPPSLGEITCWAAYNFVLFAVVPFFWFRQRYSAEQLNLTSTNWRSDLWVILVIMLVECLFELTGLNADFFKLTPRQMLIGGGLTFFAYFVGTVLPTMILIYAILLPRYLRLTGSPIVTVILSGLTYAAVHLVEGWSNFDSPRWGALSILFVFLQYVGPGMIKSVLTLRTGNAWVHAIGYHAVAPHLILDTPMFVKVLGIR